MNGRIRSPRPSERESRKATWRGATMSGAAAEEVSFVLTGMSVESDVATVDADQRSFGSFSDAVAMGW